MQYFLILAAAVGLAAADMSLTVDKLTAFIRSAIQRKTLDKDVAEYLHHVKIVEKLDDRIVEELQGMGAGAKTVAALRVLRDASTNLPVAAPPPPKAVYVPAPPPGSVEQAKIIDEAREYVMNYTKNLPNFICVQVTRRSFDPKGKDNWYHADTITTRLTYDGQKEDYQVILHNDQPVTNKSMEAFGGTTSAGEFGTMMKEIFEPESHARFSWDHWGTLRGRPTYVFAYNIEQQFSRYHMIVETNLDIVPAYRGLIYIDQDTKMVTKLTLDPYNLPETFPVRESHQSLDYDFEEIADGKYLLPLKSVLVASRSRESTKNETEFRLYRKFETGSTIKFDVTPEPLSDDKTKEKPQEDKTQKKQ
jgi:hypothetical protein